MKNFSDYIGVFDSIFSKEECDQMINFFEHQHSMGLAFNRKTTDFGCAKTLKDDETFFHDMTQPEEYTIRAYPHLPIVVDRISKCWEEYMDEYDVIKNSASSLGICPSIKIQKTQIGGGYHIWHYEHGSASAARFGVYTIYLNDVDEGGETEFLYQHKRIPAKAGTVCLFPASYTHPHRGNPPISNTKYIITGWIDLIK
jgi:hypothetical protein